jgi:hypothetical protein
MLDSISKRFAKFLLCFCNTKSYFFKQHNVTFIAETYFTFKGAINKQHTVYSLQVPENLHLRIPPTIPFLELTPWSSTILEMSPIVQLLKNFPALYGTRKFITVFTRALYWSLS